MERTPNSLLFGMSRTPQREDDYFWIGAISENIARDSYLYKLKERTDIDLTDLDSARPYKIGVGRANLFRKFFEREGFAHVEPTSGRSQGLRKLLAGRIDLLSGYSFNIVTTCERADVSTDVLLPALQLEGVSSGVYLVTSRKSDLEFRRKLEEAYEAKVKDGTFDATIGAMRSKTTLFPPDRKAPDTKAPG